MKTCGEDKGFSNIVPLLRVQNLPSPGKFTKNTYPISLKFYIERFVNYSYGLHCNTVRPQESQTLWEFVGPPNGSRGEETVHNKTQSQGKSFLFLFLSKIGI